MSLRCTDDDIVTCSGSPDILLGMVRSYERPDVALNYGLMLREAVRHERLASILLHEEETFTTLFRCIESPHFDVASDAFATCRDVLTRHKAIVADFLQGQYDRFFALYLQLIISENYVTRRQSLKLLSELLLDRSNFAVMTRFIAEPAHLKAIMNLLRTRARRIRFCPDFGRALFVLIVPPVERAVVAQRKFAPPSTAYRLRSCAGDRSASIQYEAFHVFKIFVANPRKEALVLELLRRNRDRLLMFLADFLAQREAQDDHFRDEKSFLIEEIRRL